MSLHAMFFFIGHSVGPVLYGIGFGWPGSAGSLMIGALVMVATGFMCARFLRRE